MSPRSEKTILLVEDEAIIALAEKAVLERHGYTVLVARSGEEAVRVADSGRELSLIMSPEIRTRKAAGIRWCRAFHKTRKGA